MPRAEIDMHLRDPSLLREKCFIDGERVGAALPIPGGTLEAGHAAAVNQAN